MDDTKLLTAAELASVLRCSADHVYRLAKANRLPSYRIGRQYRFDLDEVKESMASDNGGEAA